MLIISERYNSIQSLACKCKFYETKDSDNFEKSCARYLRKQFPGHTFTVKGGNNKTTSDILVDGKFYIECKMTESNNKPCVAQSTGFGIKLVDNGSSKLFECSDTASDSDAAHEILSYINNNIGSFEKLINQHSSKVAIEVDQHVLAEWMYNYYSNKNVVFFMSKYNGDHCIFKNSVDNILKYFDIIAYARYYANGTKDLPLSQRDNLIEGLKKQCKIYSSRYDDRKSIVCIKGEIENPYFDVGGTKIYLSDKNQKPNEYRVMKVSGVGSPRILFSLHTKANQDTKDLEQFKKFLNSK